MTRDIWVNHYRPFSPDHSRAKLCFLIKSASSDDEAPWEIYSGDISGFDYQWGVLSKLRIKQQPDGSYQLIEELEQQPTPPATVFTVKLNNSQAQLEHLRANLYKIDGVPVFETTNSLISEIFLAMLSPEDVLQLELMHTGNLEVPLTLTEVEVNGLPLPKPHHIYLVMGITLITAIGLWRKPQKKRLRARRFRAATI
jgi:hypothetical protein